MTTSSGNPTSGSTAAVEVRRPDVAFVLLLLGSVLALYFAGVGFTALSGCTVVGNLACFGLAALIALPGITGAVSLALALVLYLRPENHRAVGLVVAGLSAASIVLILVEFVAYPQALEFVLLLYAWPVLVTLIGGVLAFAWKAPIANAGPSPGRPA